MSAGNGFSRRAAWPGPRIARVGLAGDPLVSTGAGRYNPFMHTLEGAWEVIRPDLPRGRFRSVLFDFDGTLSLIREGWPQVMIPMMVGVLRETGTRESDADLTAAVEEFVMRLNGRQTIYQMIQLAHEVRRRGGRPLEPLAYKHRYHDLLMERIRGRLAALESGAATASDWTVPGSHALLQALCRRGVTLYLASGTDLKYVRREAELLGVAPFFGRHIYGALDDYRNFSKQMVVERILQENDLSGAELLGFGDGFVEIEEVKRAGGVAVAVASDEVTRRGVNAWKRDRLVRAGADLVIPEYRRHEELLRFLFAEE
jgi:phosphoglycolate phosphatase-like HAD superfamily hydrolase